MVAIVLSVATFGSTALGGLFALHRRHRLSLVMALSSGILVAAALLDLLPNAFALAGAAPGASYSEVLVSAAAGFLVFYGLDRFVHLTAAGHHGQPGQHDHAPAQRFGALAALGLTIHSFLDGFAIGSAFDLSAGIGVLVAVAVLAHDFGDGVSTVAVVLGSRGRLRDSIGWLLADAAAPILGAAAALLVALSPHLLSDLLGFFAGSFLFIGAAHLLPESQREGEERVTVLGVLIGFAFIALVTQVLHP